MTTTVNTTSNISEEIQATLKTLPSTSVKIRYLNSQGFSRTQIQKDFNLRTRKGEPISYQHVRNVLITPVKNSAY